MVLIGFTRFREKIENGTKRQTIRKPRKRPIQVGDKLHLYWKPRTKECELLRVEKCVSKDVVKWGDIKHDIGIAQADGFGGISDYYTFFYDTHEPSNETIFEIIKW
jgi:hypothetical protein